MVSRADSAFVLGPGERYGMDVVGPVPEGYL